MKDIPTGKELGLTAVKGRLIVTKEIAAFLRVSDRWVINHMKDGTFPFRWWLIGERCHVADSADLDDWLQKTVIEAGTKPASLPLKAIRKIQKERG